MKPSVLIVDDEHVICEGLARLLEDDYTTYKAFNGREAINIVRNNNIDIMLCDIKMPEMSGTEMIEKIRSENKDICMIVITAAPPQQVCDAMKKGANNFMTKPLDLHQLKTIMSNALKQKNIPLKCGL